MALVGAHGEGKRLRARKGDKPLLSACSVEWYKDEGEQGCGITASVLAVLSDQRQQLLPHANFGAFLFSL
jgi:hypothetical protein